MNSVLNQTFALHGVTSSFLFVTAPYNNTAASTALEGHFDRVGGPSACVILKYAIAWVARACRRRGALALVDSIDNFRAFSKGTLHNEHYWTMDAVIVQTEEHAAVVASFGHNAIVLPHPHGNLGSWSVSRATRPRLRGVGFVMSDKRNMPSRDDMRGIVKGCCRANTTLYIVSSNNDGLHVRPYSKNCSDVAWYEDTGGGSKANKTKANKTALLPSRETRGSVSGAPSGVVSSLQRLSACGAHEVEKAMQQRTPESRGGLWDALRPPSGLMLDPTHQQRYYSSAELLNLVDVGLVWRPGHQQGGPLAIRNRPPTRMHWWWSHGIPVIGYPMEAYVDAARRVHYPTELLNLSGAADIEHALRRIAPAEDRACLRATSVHGARVTSPWYSSYELFAALCELATRCGKSLPKRSALEVDAIRAAKHRGFARIGGGHAAAARRGAPPLRAKPAASSATASPSAVYTSTLEPQLGADSAVGSSATPNATS